jgi:hypothetical protein
MHAAVWLCLGGTIRYVDAQRLWSLRGCGLAGHSSSCTAGGGGGGGYLLYGSTWVAPVTCDMST